MKYSSLYNGVLTAEMDECFFPSPNTSLLFAVNLLPVKSFYGFTKPAHRLCQQKLIAVG